MRFINRLLAPVLTIASLACNGGSATGPTDSAAQQTIIAREQQKWDYFFGSAQERQTVLTWFAEDYVNVGYGPTGVSRTTYAEMAQGISYFPVFPKGSFTFSEMSSIKGADGSLIISYRVSGPGPNGPGWSAYVVSVWAKRGSEWKTIYYQATQL